MMPELGNFLLCLAAGLALLLSVYPLWGAARQDRRLMALARPLACGLFACIGGAFLLLVHAFVVNDFTVRYVAENSNSALPVWYRVAATWGAHEGSLLLWVLLLSVWTFAVAIFSRRMPLDAVARVLAVMGMIAFGFLLFILLTSNPFSRGLPQYPIDGRDLNPLLQDIGMIFHPPILYMGYVGFSVAFAFAIASLLAGRLDTAWARWSRPWTQAAWMFLTLGIVLGSAWAYYELGWGGWWFWDPVENASFMPWLVGTALLHSLAVTEKRGSFRAWTVLLAIAAFSLCLLGTFLVRSGVLVSVHAFASDPSRGLFILVLLIVAIGGSLLLYALKGGRVRARVEHTLWSRESFLLGNNILLMAAMLVVLLGTLLPLVHKELGLGSISIGEPFFNTMFTALMAPFALLLGLGPLIRWRRDDVARQIKRLIIALLVTLSLSLALPWLLQDRITAMAVIGLMMALWVLIFALMEVHERATHRHGFWRGLRTLTRSQWGMVLGHVGVAVTVIGITFSQNYSVERDVRMRPGDSIDIHLYHFVFNGVRNIVGPNWTGGEGIIAVTRNGRPEATLYAEKRFYTASRMMMTEAAISGGLTRDLYAALGEELSDGSWAVRLYYKPFVRWIWYGGVLMALGGLCCMLDPRYRMRKKSAGGLMNRKLLFIPLVLFLALAAALFWQLMRNADGDDPTTLESALIGKPLPEFRLEALNTPGQTLDRRTLIDGKPLLLNVWATWCPTCRAEHQFLNGLAQQGVRVVGMNYKDDRQKAMSWLQRLGNPYRLSLYDGNGMLGLDLGVYGAPETFLIDGQGIIRWRHAGDLNERVWREELQPLWDQYNRRAG